jgi:uncharacterized damage-inducible protein DinB
MEWADARVWAAVNATAASNADGRIRELLVHTHMTQQAFLQVWLGGTPAIRQAGEFQSLDDVEGWAREYYPQSAAYLAASSEEALRHELLVPWAAWFTASAGREPGPTTLGDTIFQAASHTTYHRGQINVRLREIGGEPPLVDYIAWLWLGSPAAVWA